MTRVLFYLGLAGLIVIADQASKAVVVAELDLYQRIDVLPFFSWVRAHNYGAAFSLFDTPGGIQRWFFVVLAVGFAGFIGYELRRLPPSEPLLGWAPGAGWFRCVESLRLG
ncbi:MAG: signal peptidase II [Pseudomonadota bacterium]